MDSEVLAYDIPGIMACQKNRYPMLFIDRVTECITGKYAKGFKLFSYNEWFFHGYETDAPKVWNVIQIEAMSQLFLMTFLSKEDLKGSIAMSNKFDKVQFFKKIEPGDRLDLEATMLSFGRGVAKGKIFGSVSGEKACSMECTIIVPNLFGNFLNTSSKLNKPKKTTSIAPKSEIDFGIEKIRRCLLNKYPWLFLDKVLEITPGKSVKAIKNFTYNESYFPKHFPEDPSVPGFIQIEACMQSFLLTFLSLEEYKRKETADRVLNNVLVKRKIIPGETLEMFATLDFFNRGIAKGKIESFVDGDPAVSFEATVVIPDVMDKYKPKVSI